MEPTLNRTDHAIHHTTGISSRSILIFNICLNYSQSNNRDLTVYGYEDDHSLRKFCSPHQTNGEDNTFAIIEKSIMEVNPGWMLYV